MANSISTTIVGVPDQALSPYKLDHYDAGIRRALPAIELGLGDRLAWSLYADLDVDKILDIAKTVYGKRFTSSQRRLFEG